MQIHSTLAMLSFLLAVFATADAAAVTPDPAAAAPTAAEKPAPEPPVSELFAVRKDIQKYLLTLDTPDSPSLRAGHQLELKKLDSALAKIKATVNTNVAGKLRFEDLIDLQTDLRTQLRSLEQINDELDSRASLRDGQLDELAQRQDNWQTLTNVARSRSAPAAVMKVANDTTAEILGAMSQVRADRDAALEDLSTISRLNRLAIAVDAELKTRRDSAEANSKKAADAPLWHVSVWQNMVLVSNARSAFHRWWQAVSTYLYDHWQGVTLWFVVLTVSAYWLLRLTGKRVEEFLQNDSMSMRASAVFARPSSAALLVGLFGTLWFGPPGPTEFQMLLLAILPFPAAALAVSVFARPIRLTVYAIAVVLALLAVKSFIAPLPLVARFVAIFQLLLVAAAIYLDYRRGNWHKAFPAVRFYLIRWLVRVVCVFLLVVAGLEIIGFVGLADTLRSFVLGALGFGMIFTSITYVVTGLILALVHVRPFSDLPVVRNQRWTIVKTARKSIRIFMGFIWATVTLSVSGMLTGLVTWLQTILSKDISIGAINLHVSSMATGALILFVTWLVTRLIGFLLASKSLSGVHVAADVTFAISKILRYGIALGGFLFAIIAMGFDITKVTVLAGALGVGIGFGLQNIVNNFVSGLILLFERPIKIDDIANVDDLMGRVKEIGIRATVIETFDGAEVIVPNADLVSKVVTNWTKSNRRRRAEIDVGVAYGSDSQQIIDLLESVAKSHGEVMTDPAPFAVFVGFGDSSLNFRLYVWLADLTDVVRAPGKIRQELLNELAAANIEIPFPQRDVRVTMSPAPAETPAVQPESKPIAAD